MRLWKRKRRYPGADETLSKYVYLKDSEVSYRFATATPLTRARLDEYYAQITILYDERRKAFTFYGLVFAVSILAAFNGIREASASGITVSSDFLKHAALILWPWAQCRMGILGAKYSFIASLFKQRLSRSDPPGKVDLLARYPLAIGFDEYYLEQIGSLPFLVRMRAPLRLLTFIVLVGVGLLAYAVFAVWIYLKLAVAVIETPGLVPTFWSWCVVVASVAMMLFSYALPATNIFRKRYTHVGLVTLMTSFGKRDPSRYSHFVRLAWEAKERMDRSD